VILYSPYVTYHELKQIYKYYKMKYFELNQIDDRIEKEIYLVQKEPPRLPDGTDAVETPMCEVSVKSFQNDRDPEIKTLAFGDKCNSFRPTIDRKNDDSQRSVERNHRKMNT